MTGHAYATSARTAARMGPFAGYTENAEHMLRVLRMHRAEVAKIDEEIVPTSLLGAAQESWDATVDLAEQYGVRNSQASVLAPTGTISFLMDCDTTGIEPDLGLVKTKKLVGGGTMSIVNQTIPRALTRLGYTQFQIDSIVAYIDANMSIVGAPHVEGRAPTGVRMLDGRQRHPLHGPRTDDGRGTAVHQRVDKQDHQYAGVGDCRRGRAHAHGVVEVGPQGRRDLPRQLQGRAAAFDHEEGGGRNEPERDHRCSADDRRRADRREDHP